MDPEDQQKQKIKLAFLEYAHEHELPNVNTMSYYSRQFLPEESFFLKRDVLNELIESGVMISRNGKWILKK